MSINGFDINVSMLLSLFLANIRNLSCFFFVCLVILNNFVVIPVVRERNKLRLALAILTGTPTIVVNEINDTPPVASLKTIKAWSI